MTRSHLVQGLLFTVSALTLFAGCAEVNLPQDPTEPPLARLVASERSTAELGVATWEVRADGADVQVIGRDAGSARQVELIVRRDAAAPEDRVQIEAVFPQRGALQLDRTGVIEAASSDYLRRLGADIHADLGQGATPVVVDGGLGSATSAIAINDRGTIHLGWQLFGYTVNTTVGGACRTGTIRHHGEIYADYGASAVWLGWAYSGPATDCTAKFSMSVQNGHWDDFHWSIFTTP
jgi:hypothetical protein